MNSFFFCNKVPSNPTSNLSTTTPTSTPSLTTDKQNVYNNNNSVYNSEYLTYIASKLSKKYDLSSCTFNTTSDKKNTLRNQLYEVNMKNCVTV